MQGTAGYCSPCTNGHIEGRLRCCGVVIMTPPAASYCSCLFAIRCEAWQCRGKLGRHASCRKAASALQMPPPLRLHCSSVALCCLAMDHTDPVSSCWLCQDTQLHTLPLPQPACLPAHESHSYLLLAVLQSMCAQRGSLAWQGNCRALAVTCQG